MSQSWRLNHMAHDQGITVKALLKQVCHCYQTQREAAAYLGITVSGFNAACRRNGVVWDHSRSFEYDGVVDTMIGHCTRYGIDPRRAYLYRFRKAYSRVEALTDLIAQRQAVAA